MKKHVTKLLEKEKIKKKMATQKKAQPEMSEIDIVIAKCVDEIWSKYDKDNSGELDKNETK